jgi:hypothetical protein
MLVVKTIAKIRRAFFIQQKPIKAICREFWVSRKVVRKVIRSQAAEFRYERGRQPLPRIDPWRDQLGELLLADEGKSARERLTLIRIFEELRGFGCEGSYDAVRRYAKRWRAGRGAAMAEAFVPLSFAPGEAYRKFADSLLEGDGFELPVREHRAMAPSHGFAAASHREAALRGAPASHGETAFRGAAGFREARRHEVHPARARWRSTRGQPRHRFC